ncbi:MFS transporter [Leifsonia sp. H3M29-4]|uniref:MFS transporter n=1 Tax=Salinibacterium metalliresistens TaxID=3031321 RepID=UPI0023DAF1C8|nr:MFS transporter [Salinibacterium metalliresistens]MDF1477634.1 MFS transporter [Salinibacterium metalliresistens]
MTDAPDAVPPTDKTLPAAANTLAIGVMGLELQEGVVVPRRRVFAWAFWDWATQPFNTVLLTFVWVPSYLTSTFFVDPAVIGTAGEEAALGQLASYLGYGVTVAGLLIALLAPVLGQRADRAGRQKLQLLVFTGLLIASQLGMVFVQPGGEWFWMGVALIAVGSVFGEIAGVNYNALLISVSNPRTIGKVSGLGWGFGYLGGIVALAVVVGLILGGVLDGTAASTFQMIALGCTIWTVIFVIPIFVSVPEPSHTYAGEKVGFFQSYVELVRGVIRLYKETRPTFWFLLASAVYRDGLSAVFTFGSIIAAVVFGFGFTDLVIFGIVLNIVAGVSTILAGRLDDLFGPKRVILVSVFGLVACTLVVFFGAGLGAPLFWAAGIVLALFVGPAQAASRSFLARVTPAGREGEVFGLYATTGRAAGWMASLLWGVFIAIAASQTLYGILGITLVLLAGGIMLLFVKAPPAAVKAHEA